MLTVRRINITANDVIDESRAITQIDLFTDLNEKEKEKLAQKAALSIKNKYGKNAVFRGTDLVDGATAKERNSQVGGHKA